MSTSTSSVSHRSSRPTHPGPVVHAVGWLMAAWCVGFATVNVVLEVTGHLAAGPYAEHAAAFTVMNWLVVALKLVGAAVAVLAVAKRAPVLPPPLLGVLVWGGFATLAVYVLGSTVQAVGLVLGVTGEPSRLDLLSVAYLAFFMTAAVGWGVLAVSYSRRHGLGRRPALLGVLGAPVVLGFVLVAVPAVLVATGVMPSS